MNNNLYSIVSLDNFFTSFLKNAKNKLHSDKCNKAVKRLARNQFSKFIIKNFRVAHNNEILNNYVHKRMLLDNVHNYSKSFFLTALHNSHEILGLITIGLRAINISKVLTKVKRQLIPKGISPSHVKTIPTYSIEQVAKNGLLPNNPIHGEDILDTGIYKIKNATKDVGGVVVTLSAIMPPNEPGAVISIYSKYGFSKFDTPRSPKADTNSPIKYQPMFLNIM